MTTQPGSWLKIVHKLTNLLSCPDFIAQHRTHPKHFTRKRHLTFPNLVLFLLNQPNSALQTELDAFFQTLNGSAFETERANNWTYWLVTNSPDDAAHPNVFLWVSGVQSSVSNIAQAIIKQLAGQRLPENMETGDLTLTPIPGIGYYHLVKAMPFYIDLALCAKPTLAKKENTA